MRGVVVGLGLVLALAGAARRPADDGGAWFGLNLSFGAAEPHHAPPECEAAVHRRDAAPHGPGQPA